MPISFSCTSCGRALRVKDELAGRQILCPDCQTKLTVPTPESEGLPSFEPPPLPSESAYREEQPQTELAYQRTGERLPPRPELEDEFDDEPIRRRPPPKPAKEFWTTNAGIGGGLLMMVIGVVVFVLCLFLDRISIWGPIIFIIGLVAFIKGLVNRES